MESTIVVAMWSIGVLVACAAPVELRHATLSTAVEDAHSNIVARFIGPEGLLRDYEGETPTPADCRDCRPNAMGWWSPIENGPMFTGPYLEAVCARARRTGDPAILGHRKKYERKTMTLPLSAAAVCAFAGAARADVDRTLRSYDYSQINLCEFFLAEVAAERMFEEGRRHGNGESTL